MCTDIVYRHVYRHVHSHVYRHAYRHSHRAIGVTPIKASGAGSRFSVKSTNSLDAVRARVGACEGSILSLMLVLRELVLVALLYC